MAPEAPISDSVCIVVPFTEWHEWVLDCVRECDKLEEANATIWLLPNAAPTPEWEERLKALEAKIPVHIEPTGPGNPAVKRNVALKKCHARIFGFIDSDAFPRSDWIKNGLALLEDDVPLVTGPNLTPTHDPVSRRASGHVMESRFGFGASYIRHTPVSRQFVHEMPTCNMLYRRVDDLLFREEHDTGEDMIFCSEVRGKGFRIVYDPEFVVYHHRRNIFRPFMKQFYFYGLDKGRLTRGGSDVAHVWQSLPAMITLYLPIAVLVWLIPLPLWLTGLFSVPLLAYAGIILFESIRLSTAAKEIVPTILSFIAGHLSYGWGYIRGFVVPGPVS